MKYFKEFFRQLKTESMFVALSLGAIMIYIISSAIIFIIALITILINGTSNPSI